MSIIYSRHKIKLPKFFSSKDKKNEKINKIIFILFLIFMILGIVIASVTPVFIQLCEDKAKSMAIMIVNEETNNVIKKYNYSDFIIIHKDGDGNVLMLESNMVNLNNIIALISINVQDRINNTDSENIEISLGSFTGISLLSGRGYSVPIKISTIGNIDTDIRSEFISTGINQTLHRLYLNIKCEISVLTPFNTVTQQIENEVILAENVIVGNIPETYYNLDNLQIDDATNLIN